MHDDIEFFIPTQKKMDDLSRTLLARAKVMYEANPFTQYHSWSHAMGLCVAIKRLWGDISTEEELAAAYHDIIYIPGAEPGYNEEMSAAAFRAALMKASGEHPEAARHLRGREVEEIIRCTRVDVHMEQDPEGILDAVQSSLGFDERFARSVRRVLDADLAGLAAPWDQFVKNQADIIWEAAGRWTDEPEWLLSASNKQKSARFLLRFLDRPYIYHTPEARAAWEPAAWMNIVRWCRENNVPLK